MTLGASRKIERLIGRYQQRFPVAIARALNRTGTSTRAFMARRMASDLSIPVGRAKNEIRVVRQATVNEPVVRLEVTGNRIAAIHFNARGPYPSRGKGSGVTAKLPGSPYPHAFIAIVGKGRHRGVFQRYDAAGRKRRRGPRGGRIYELKGPSLPKVFEKFAPEGLAHGEETLRKNLAHELRFAIKQESLAI